MDLVEISPDPLKVGRIISHVTLPNCGAISIFIGTTKDRFEDKKVLRLEYEVYQDMAIQKMQEIAKEMRLKWTVKKTAIIHRTGLVPIGESSIIISACSEHRNDAQEAVKWALEQVKAKAPIWKREVYEDGSCWKENKECFWMKEAKN